jgi:hypothetical protein
MNPFISLLKHVLSDGYLSFKEKRKHEHLKFSLKLFKQNFTKEKKIQRFNNTKKSYQTIIS